MKTVLRFLRDERGTETVEWAIMIGLIAVGAIGLAAVIGGDVTRAFTGLRDACQGTHRLRSSGIPCHCRRRRSREACLAFG